MNKKMVVAKSKWDEASGCTYLNGSWCKLPKGFRCSDCQRLKDGSKVCGKAIVDTHND